MSNGHSISAVGPLVDNQRVRFIEKFPTEKMLRSGAGGTCESWTAVSLTGCSSGASTALPAVPHNERPLDNFIKWLPAHGTCFNLVRSAYIRIFRCRMNRVVNLVTAAEPSLGSSFTQKTRVRAFNELSTDVKRHEIVMKTNQIFPGARPAKVSGVNCGGSRKPHVDLRGSEPCNLLLDDNTNTESSCSIQSLNFRRIGRLEPTISLKRAECGPGMAVEWSPIYSGHSGQLCDETNIFTGPPK